ncbi:MAG TPA: inositol monophosphatase family protein, partial [Myxococcota bacterium]|nr:inositol monophosphatase family protein [Myxococcota bacterium]
MPVTEGGSMESSGFSHELEVAIRLARRAGEVILRHYATNFAVDYKDEDATDPVTQADRDANNIIVAGLAAAFPADAILAEESAASPTRHGHRRLWCVDPVDGTREFVDHNGQFAVMIGLAVEGVAEVGVIYQPTEDHLAYGAAGRAVSVLRGEERPLHVSKQAHPAHATLMVSRSHRSRSVQRVAQDLNI